MTYTVRTIDRCFTEAHYDNFEEMVQDWSSEIMAGTHYFLVAME
jgi:hypothetical protein